AFLTQPTTKKEASSTAIHGDKEEASTAIHGDKEEASSTIKLEDLVNYFGHFRVRFSLTVEARKLSEMTFYIKSLFGQSHEKVIQRVKTDGQTAAFLLKIQVTTEMKKGIFVIFCRDSGVG
nr:hypothetical protein [Tanacetum cinerariifolium]